MKIGYKIGTVITVKAAEPNVPKIFVKAATNAGVKASPHIIIPRRKVYFTKFKMILITAAKIPIPIILAALSF